MNHLKWGNFLLIFISALVLLLLPIFYFQSDSNETGHNQSETTTANTNEEQNNTTEENGNNEDGNEKANTTIDPNADYWGVDSASYTTEELYACVNENFGKPTVWGRYLGTIDGVSSGLTTEEVEYLHANGVKILLINNQFNNATGYENGVEQANIAISLAGELNAPEGVAIFADIEPNYPVDSAFIQGWFDTMMVSPYEPGIYGVFSPDSALVEAYQASKNENQGIQNKIILWTAYPHVDVTTQANVPANTAEAPEGSLLYGWQYGIDAATCNIDTNLFKGSLFDFLW
ncbi:glycoside hydrolase domain-containing protein [Robertmurraya sp. P23]|uniref:glycoside hydrolase domain-containing protein n=1 Tax=Robertmurraya sp. P23 TaxID=3436931 RepID=UPI003D97F999